MQVDKYGLQVTVQPKAKGAWLQGLDASLAFDDSGITHLQNAIKLDPEFVLARACLARQQMIHGFSEQAHDSLQLALSASQSLELSERETSQLGVINAAMNFNPKTLSMALEHVERWSLDVQVLSMIVGPFGLMAFSRQSGWREANLSLLQSSQTLWPDKDWWYQTTLAFAYSEVGELSKARDLAESAWQLRHAGNCAHTLSHVYFEQGDAQEGRIFLESWVDDYGNGSDMRHHLQWHLSLLDFDDEIANSKSMHAKYQEELDHRVSDPMPLTTFSDNASFLWRCHLNDISISSDFIQDTREYGKQHFPNAGFEFADMHQVVVDSLSLEDKEKKTEHNEFNSSFIRDLTNATNAYMARDYLAAANFFADILCNTILLGGSNPQRRLIEDSYLQACLRSGEKERAFAVLNSRKAQELSRLEKRFLFELKRGNKA